MLESRCSELRQKIHIFQIQQQQYLAATATVRQGDVRNSTLIELNSDSDCDSNTESDSDSESESKSESESESESDNGSDSSSVSGSDTYDKSTTEENSNSGSGGESDGSDLGDYERINPGHDTSRRRSLDHGITTGAGEASASLDKAHSCSTTDNNNDIAETKTRDINSIHTSTTPAINNSGLLDIIHASRHSNDSSNDVHITSLIRHPQSADKNIIPERKTIRSRIRQQQHQIHALKEQIKQLKTKSQTWKERVRQDNILIIQGKLALEKLTKEVELLKYQRDTLAFTSGDDGRKLRSVKEQTLLDEEHKKERTLLRKKNHNLTHATLSALTSLNHALNHYLSLSHNMHLINKMHANQIGFTLSFSCAGILNVKEMRNKQSPEKPNTFISLSIGHHHDFQFYRDQSTKTKKNNTTRKKTKNPHNDDGSSCEIFRPSPLSSYRQNTFIINGLIKGEGEDIHNDNYLNIDKETFDSSSCGLPSELNHTIAHSYQLVGHTEVKNNSVNPKFSSRLQVMPPPGKVNITTPPKHAQ